MRAIAMTKAFLLAITLSAFPDTALSVTSPLDAPPSGVMPHTSVTETLNILEDGRVEAWNAFAEEHGPTWKARWNLRTSLPHRAFGKGIPLAAPGARGARDIAGAAEMFVRSQAALLGCDLSELRLEAPLKRGGMWFLTFRQVHRGLDVFSGKLIMRLSEEGELVLFGSDVYPGIEVDTDPDLPRAEAERLALRHTGLPGQAARSVARNLVIYPLETASAFEYRLTWRVVVTAQTPPAHWIYLIDAHTGEVLKRWSEVRYATVGGGVFADVWLPNYCGERVEVPLRDIQITVLHEGDSLTDAGGSWLLDVNGNESYQANFFLFGPYFNVNLFDGDDAFVRGELNSNVMFDLQWTDENAQPEEREAYYHGMVAHEAIKTIDPDFTGVDYAMHCTVNIPSYCNAYYDGSGINFFEEGMGCANTARLPTVIYHEYGHAVTHKLYGERFVSGAQHEGWSDYFAATIADTPVVGDGFFGCGTYLRMIDNEKVYGPDSTGQSHEDGTILAAFLWHMRENLTEVLPADEAKATADTLFHFARYGYASNFPDYVLDIFVQDDDDADLTNDTPHYPQICAAAERHGFRCPETTLFTTAHEALPPTVNTTRPYLVEATIEAENDLTDGSVRLLYEAEYGAGEVVMAAGDGPHIFVAEIAASGAGSMVRYFIEIEDADGYVARIPEDAPGGQHAFFIGPVEEIFFDDFEGDDDGGWTHLQESGEDDWQRGAPTGAGGWDPTYAHSGSSCWGTDLAVPQGNGNYRDNTVSYLASPPIDCQDASGMRLQFRRWLTVEQAPHDKTWITVNGVSVWTNDQAANHIDTGWTFQDLDISEIADGSAEVVVRFHLSADRGLTFGGWTIDDVALVSFTGECIDQDQDGYADSLCGGEDCDDTDPWFGPDMPEICDGMDNDCNGLIPCHEADGDNDGVRGCAGDCDDSDPAVGPQFSEATDTENCEDGKDNDCDGLADAADPECFVDETEAASEQDGEGGCGCATMGVSSERFPPRLFVAMVLYLTPLFHIVLLRRAQRARRRN